jgi:hypothetical protein
MNRLGVDESATGKRQDAPRDVPFAGEVGELFGVMEEEPLAPIGQ